MRNLTPEEKKFVQNVKDRLRARRTSPEGVVIGKNSSQQKEEVKQPSNSQSNNAPKQKKIFIRAKTKKKPLFKYSQKLSKSLLNIGQDFSRPAPSLRRNLKKRQSPPQKPQIPTPEQVRQMILQQQIQQAQQQRTIWNPPSNASRPIWRKEWQNHYFYETDLMGNRILKKVGRFFN